MGDTINTTININGKTAYQNSYRLGGCCCNNSYSMSCFGYGFPDMGAAIGFGMGMAAVAIGVPLLPKFFNWMGTKALPAVWNGFIKPIGIGIGEAAAWVGKGIAKGVAGAAKGIKNLWNSIFHKKSKSKVDK